MKEGVGGREAEGVEAIFGGHFLNTIFGQNLIRNFEKSDSAGFGESVWGWTSMRIWTRILVGLWLDF